MSRAVVQPSAAVISVAEAPVGTPAPAAVVEPKDGRLKRRLLKHVIGTLAAGVLVTAITCVVLLTQGFPSWVEDTQHGMVSAEKASINRTTAEKALFTSEVFRRVQHDTAVLQRLVTDVLGKRQLGTVGGAGLAMATSFTSQGLDKAALEEPARYARADWYVHALTEGSDCAGGDCRAWPPRFVDARMEPTDPGAARATIRAAVERQLANASAAMPAFQALRESLAGTGMRVKDYDMLYLGLEPPAGSDHSMFLGYPLTGKDEYLRRSKDGRMRAHRYWCDGRARYSRDAAYRQRDWVRVAAKAGSNVEPAAMRAGRADPANPARGLQYEKLEYDPRCRGWYQSAKQAGGLIFTAPYVFVSTGALGMTAAVPVYDEPDAPGMTPAQRAARTFLGVVGIDFSIDAIDGNLAGQMVAGMPRMYGYMLAHNGQVASHPLLDDAKKLEGKQYLLRDLEEVDATDEAFAGAERGLREGCSALAEHRGKRRAPRMRADGRGFEAAGTDAAEPWYLAYAPETVVMQRPCDAGFPAAQRTQGFGVAMTVPRGDVYAPFRATSDRINVRLAVATVVLAVLVVLVGLGVVWVAAGIANSIARPVARLLRVMRALNARDFTFDTHAAIAEHGAASPEMAVLMKVCDQMGTVVKFANVSLQSGNVAAARTSYEEALQLFTALRNKKGVGVCQNNLGSAHLLLAQQAEKAHGAGSEQAQAEYREALACFEEARADAAEQLDAQTGRYVVGLAAAPPPYAAAAAEGAGAGAAAVGE
eukprot:g6036.t1